MEVARYAPNGANRQVIKWIVVNDAEKVHKITQMTVDWMILIKEKNPALYKEAKMDLFVGPWELGQDRVSRGAPRVIVACAPKDERTAPPAAMIAIAQIQLAATALGLGTTFTGTFDIASQGYPPMMEILGLQEGYIPFGTFVIGYPAERYLRIPTRKPVDVIWK